jgi:TRAP-type C4-dicarboxylate transport system substrate-binding protein
MNGRRVWFVVALAALAAGGAVSTGAQGVVQIRMATVVPQGSLWDESLQYIRQEWGRISGGSVHVTIYAGGTQGDEAETVRKVNRGQLQAVALSSVGLSRIDSGVACLQLPLLLDSYAELDYVRDRVAAALEQRMEAKGFKVLNWADGGWVYAFARSRVRTPDDLRARKLFTSAGDPESERLYKRFGFRVVPLSLSDLVTSLQTGMIDAFTSVPLFALLNESYKLAPHMTDVRWAPLVGGTVISVRTWERIPLASRAPLVAAARGAGDRLRADIRKMDADAVKQMESRGLKVAVVDAATRAQWQKTADDAYPTLRGEYCPADLFDEVLRLRDAFRKQTGAGAR